MNLTHLDQAVTTELLDVMGPTVQFLTDPSEHGIPYCVIRGTIPAGASVPLHSHPDAESFYVLSGTAQTLVAEGGRLEWRIVNAGDFVHIPGSVRHAHRNVTSRPVVELIVTTPAIGRFFQEIGRRVTSGERLSPPDPAELRRFAAAAARHHHWLASPEENAAVGIKFP